MSKGSKVVFVAYVHNIDTFNAMLKGSKEALTVLFVTHVTHVKRVESGVCGLCTQYRYIQCYVKRVKRLCYVKLDTNTFLLITLLILNQFSIRKKFWKASTIPSNVMYVEGVKSYFDFEPF